MKVWFTAEAWEDYLHWTTADRDTHQRVNDLIEDTRRHPFTGLGKPEPLKGPLAGFWSRRITREHRLVYRVAGKAGEDQRVEMVQCRYHYG